MTYDPNWREHDDLPGEIREPTFEFNKPKPTWNEINRWKLNSTNSTDLVLIDHVVSWTFDETVKISHEWIKVNLGEIHANQFLKDLTP